MRNCDTHKELQSYVNASRLKEYSQGENIRDQYPVQDIARRLFQDNTDSDGDDVNHPVPITPEQESEPEIHNAYFPVDKLLKIRQRAGKRVLYVKWKDGTKTWKPENNLSQKLVREYFVTHTRQGKKRKFPSTLQKP